MTDLLKNLALDRWYKVLIAGSLVLLAISLTTPILVIPNAALACISAGGFLIGLGEWVNHPKITRLQPMFGGFAHWVSHERVWHLGGVLLDIAGAIAIGRGVYLAAAFLF